MVSLSADLWGRKLSVSDHKNPSRLRQTFEGLVGIANVCLVAAILSSLRGQSLPAASSRGHWFAQPVNFLVSHGRFTSAFMAKPLVEPQGRTSGGSIDTSVQSFGFTMQAIESFDSVKGSPLWISMQQLSSSATSVSSQITAGHRIPMPVMAILSAPGGFWGPIPSGIVDDKWAMLIVKLWTKCKVTENSAPYDCQQLTQ